MIKAITVTAREDFRIEVLLEDGRKILFDMSFIKSETGPVVEPLKSSEEFAKVFVRSGIVTWPSGYDIDPYFLVENGRVIEKTA